MLFKLLVSLALLLVSGAVIATACYPPGSGYPDSACYNECGYEFEREVYFICAAFVTDDYLYEICMDAAENNYQICLLNCPCVYYAQNREEVERETVVARRDFMFDRLSG